ncbi:MAG: ATP-binding protein [Polyangiaceae bacterium]
MSVLADILASERDEIVRRFVRATEKSSATPDGVPRTLLVDKIPRFLDEMVARLARSAHPWQPEATSSATAREHGVQREKLGYDLTALVREYGILRHCILEVAREKGASLAIEEIDVLGACMNVGIEQAATEYIKQRDREANAQMQHLEFLAEAGELLASSLDYRTTLGRLAMLIVPRLADWCAIHLEGTSVDDMPIAHVVPAKQAALRELYRFPLDGSARGYPRVVKTGEPVLVSDVEPDFYEKFASSPEQLALLRSIDTKSWIIVPLTVAGHSFGAVTLAFSESDRRYTKRDLVVANDLARRAAVAIDNARVYELSQRERSRTEAATRAKDEFVAMVSHELRTPLNAIVGWLGLLRGGSLSRETTAHGLDVLDRNAKAQSRLIEDLLDISRMLTGAIRIVPAQLDLATVVEMAVEGVRPAADAKRISIEVDIDHQNAVMRGDADRLQQVMWNLLVNAVKFTPKDGSVKVTLQRIDSDLEVRVEDNGVGIPSSFLPHVFEAFRQMDGSMTRRYGGLGLGLSIAKHVVDLHGGHMEAKSAGEGQGTTILVHLPISPVVSTTMGIARVPATGERSSREQLPVARERVRVLVVDDEEDARDLLGYVFAASGMECRAAASVEEAMKILESFTPEVIVSDIGMPVEDGFSFIRRIRTLEGDRASIPAVALTAFAGTEQRKRALVDGFNVHLAKPVEPAKLVRTVLELVDATRLSSKRPA